MVAITVTMMVGLSLLVLSFDGPPDKVHADFRLELTPGGALWGDGNEEIHVQHIGGETVPRDATRITVAVNGVRTTFAGAALDQGFADGKFGLGEMWNVTLMIPGDAVVQIAIIHTEANQVISNNVLSADLTLATTGNSTITYFASATASSGSISDVDNAKSASNGVSATITESTGASGSATSRRDAGSVSSHIGATSWNDALVEGGGRAVLSKAGDEVTVQGFTVPAGATSITSVKIGLEGQKGSGNQGNPVVALKYTGVPGPLSSTQVTLTTTSDVAHILDVTPDKTPWNVADIGALQVQVERITANNGATNALIDHIFIEITYTTAPATDADVKLDFAAVPSAGMHELQIRYGRTGDTFAVMVHGDSGWVQRGTLSSSSMALFTHTLTDGEYRGGAPEIRLVDLDSGTSAGVLELDYVRIQSV